MSCDPLRIKPPPPSIFTPTKTDTKSITYIYNAVVYPNFISKIKPPEIYRLCIAPGGLGLYISTFVV